MERKQCVPVTEDARDNLKSAEVYQYFIRALNRELPLSLAPPVQPKAGSIYLYDLGPDSDKWESLKKKIRLDMQKLYKHAKYYLYARATYILRCISFSLNSAVAIIVLLQV